MAALDIGSTCRRLVELAAAQQQALASEDTSAWAALAAEREELYDGLLSQLRARPTLDEASCRALHAVVEADGRLVSVVQAALAAARSNLAALRRDRIALQGYAAPGRRSPGRFVDQTL